MAQLGGIDRKPFEAWNRVEAEIKKICDTFMERLAALKGVMNQFELVSKDVSQDIEYLAHDKIVERLNELKKGADGDIVPAVAFEYGMKNKDWEKLLIEWAYENGYTVPDEC
jgi:hypothetical protein